ncbi:MAG TPA: beta-1,3-glucanase family protein [Candidatus Baltobacteraceae bacterium]
MSKLQIDRRVFLAGLAASGTLAACSRAGSSLIPSKAATLATPKSASPGSIVPSPMPRTAILPASEMTRRTPQSVNVPLTWQQVPGSASQVSVAADGSLWVLSDAPAAPADRNIWHYQSGTWQNISGVASEIAIAPNGTLYAINAEGGIYAYADGAWTGIGGSASSIAALADNSIVVTAFTGGSDDAIWRYVGGNWTQMVGGAVAVYGSTDGNNYSITGQPNPIINGGFYLTNYVGGIYHQNTDTQLVQLPGNASDLTDTIGGVMVLGFPAPTTGNGTNIYFFDYASQSWEQQGGAATSLSFNDGTLYVTSANGGIYYSPAAIPVPLTIDVTQSGIPSDYPVYAYITGGYLKNGNAADYIPLWIDAAGTPNVMNQTDSTSGPLANAANTFPNTNPNNAGTVVTGADIAAIEQSYNQAWADYSIHISPTTPTVIDLSKLSQAYVPGLGTGAAAFSGRIYLSVGIPKLPFSPSGGSPATGFAQPALTGTYGGGLLFDWIEFSIDSNFGFNSNITQVNGIGLFLGLSATPGAGGATQGAYTITRSELFAALTSAGGGFGDCLVPNNTPSAFPPSVTNLRALSPTTVVGTSTALQSYFDTEIANAYTAWMTTPLCCYDATNTGDGWLTGLAASASGPLNFYAGELTTLTPEEASSMTPVVTVTGSNGMLSSTDVFGCYAIANPAPASITIDMQNNCLKAMEAAFNRGVALTLQGEAPNQYYELRNDAATCVPDLHTDYEETPNNAYAAIVHNDSVTRLGYAFPFDDVCGDNPTVAVQPASTINITLGAF